MGVISGFRFLEMFFFREEIVSMLLFIRGVGCFSTKSFLGGDVDLGKIYWDDIVF